MSFKANYHTHTPRCKHASGTEREYCEKAIENGFSLVGFSDHCAWPYEDGFVSTFHMDLNRLPDYVEAVNDVRREYEGRLEIHLGWECENYPAYMGWLAETKAQYGFEYLILGNHFDTTDNGGLYFGSCRTPEQLKRYVTMCVEGLETGLFAYFAHPDLFLRMYPRYDRHARAASRELCRAAKDMNIPLEYNLLGFINCRGRAEGLGYPVRGFWETAAEEGADCVVGLDAHSPARFDERREWDEACAFLDSLGLRRLERLAL
ncbi:MAG: histidinol-phosphatase [Clostridia bacterium]|nr:histidinol-phosphatase [Clostridia bacterium]